MNGPDEEMADGPWRTAARFDVAILAEPGKRDAAEAASVLNASLPGSGLPAAEARVVPLSGLHAALREAAVSGTDILMLAAPTVIAPPAMAELRRVADTDPMIAAVLPRFSTGPQDPLGAAYPTVDYVLLPDHRCVYMKSSALAELGGSAVWAESDGTVAGLLLALNRIGFRVAVAGRALAFHPDGPSGRDREVIPHDWRMAVNREEASAPRLADALMTGLRPGPQGRRAVAFDLSHVGPGHSGTTALARALVRRAATRWTDLDLYVVATPDTFAFHFGDLGAAVARTDTDTPRTFAALIRIGQPFLWREIDAATRRAPVLVLFLLDTIGLDCQLDAPDELDALWRFCLAEADGLLFNSAFTKRQFARRFSIPATLPALVSLHSLDIADYRIGTIAPASPDGGILVIGNAMPHKRLDETVRLLVSAALPCPVTVVGLPAGAVPGVVSTPSGGLSPERMTDLYAGARVVVYPSTYEGFGFPILDALAHRRPILVRPLPPYAEIASGLPESANVHFYAGDADLLRLLRDPPAWSEVRADVPVRTWDAAADDLRAVLDAALAAADRARVVRRIDGLRGRMSFMRARALEGGDDDELDRLAGHAGRLARGAVLEVGRRLPGGRALLAGLTRRLRPRA